MLGRREHSAWEIRRKLKLKHTFADADQIDLLLQKLQEDGYQSDTRFTQSLIRSRITRGYGPFYIRRELSSKGVTKSTIEQTMQADDTDWLKLASAQVQRRYFVSSDQNGDQNEEHGQDRDRDRDRDQDQDQDQEKNYHRASRFLQRRGFPADVAAKALRKAQVD